MKEYWNKAERLRRTHQPEIHEIRLLHQRAEGMNGNGISDMPKTVSPRPQQDGRELYSKSWHWNRRYRKRRRSMMP